MDANIKCADKKANLGRRSPLGQKAGGLQYEHLSTVVGEEACTPLLKSQLKKAVDLHIRESWSVGREHCIVSSDRGVKTQPWHTHMHQCPGQ